MEQKIADNILKDKRTFETLFAQRDKSPDIYFNYHAGYLLPEKPFIFPLPKNSGENFSDEASFQLNLLLPLDFRKYTAVEVADNYMIEDAFSLLASIKTALWYEFTEPLLKKGSFTEYPRTFDYLDYHYNWYLSKGGKSGSWLRYFTHAWTSDGRIIEARQQLQEGNILTEVSEFFPSVAEDIDEWLRLKSQELKEATHQQPLASIEKIKFHSSGAAFAFFIRQMVDMGLIEAPKNRNQEDDVEELLKTMLQHYEVIKPDTGEEYSLAYLIKAYKETKLSHANEAAYTFKSHKNS